MNKPTEGKATLDCTPTQLAATVPQISPQRWRHLMCSESFSITARISLPMSAA